MIILIPDYSYSCKLNITNKFVAKIFLNNYLIEVI